MSSHVCSKTVLGEELGFHYCMTEWSMASPFECAKGGQSIQGFAHLDAEAWHHLKDKLLKQVTYLLFKSLDIRKPERP